MITLEEYFTTKTNPLVIRKLLFRLQDYENGDTLTTNELFEGIELLGDLRGRGAYTRHLKRLGFLEFAGVTTENQEGRHHGIAYQWRVRR